MPDPLLSPDIIAKRGLNFPPLPVYPCGGKSDQGTGGSEGEKPIILSLFWKGREGQHNRESTAQPPFLFTFNDDGSSRWLE